MPRIRPGGLARWRFEDARTLGSGAVDDLWERRGGLYLRALRGASMW
jgi:hypothetical protein